MATMPRQKPGRSKQDYGTPQVFIDAVKGLLDIDNFEVDLAATASNTKAPFYYDVSVNSLEQPWHIGDGWNWLNPPYANITDWVERAHYFAHHHGTSTAILIPAGVGSNWWRKWVHEKCLVMFLNGRITFDGTLPNPKTGKPDPYPKDCALLLYGVHPLRDIRPAIGYDIWRWQS